MGQRGELELESLSASAPLVVGRGSHLREISSKHGCNRSRRDICSKMQLEVYESPFTPLPD